MNIERPHSYRLFSPSWSTLEALSKADKTFSENDAFSLALASALSYETDTEGKTHYTLIDHHLKSWGFKHCAHFEASHRWDIDTEGFLASNNETTLVVFRGSDSKEDWRANMQISKEPGPFDDTYVHKGMQEAYLHVAFDLGRLIERFHNPDKTLWITGHSQGGALATLFSASLCRRGISVDGLYTFASPRVGDSNFCKAFDAHFNGINIRITNKNDVVPHLPLEALFEHLGILVVLRESAPPVVDTELSFWQGVKENVVGQIENWLDESRASDTNPFVNCHMLWTESGYLNQLYKLLKI